MPEPTVSEDKLLVPLPEGQQIMLAVGAAPVNHNNNNNDDDDDDQDSAPVCPIVIVFVLNNAFFIGRQWRWPGCSAPGRRRRQ
jgi:hypothetical protein